MWAAGGRAGGRTGGRVPADTQFQGMINHNGREAGEVSPRQFWGTLNTIGNKTKASFFFVRMRWWEINSEFRSSKERRANNLVRSSSSGDAAVFTLTRTFADLRGPPQNLPGRTFAAPHTHTDTSPHFLSHRGILPQT